LIRPLDVKADPVIDPNSLPIARTAQRLNYADMDAPKPLEFLAIPLRLLRPINLLVMFFILLAQALCQLMMVVILGGYWLLLLFWPVLQAMMISHFANVIDETGPTNHDELPTPLRHLSWHDDTVGPFFRVMQALAVCYGPAILMLWYLHVKSVASIVLPISTLLAAAGTILFPAAVLTAVTSGSMVNLRPDRIAGVALKCGPEYILAVLAWILGGATWLAGTLALSALALSAVSPSTLGVPPVVNMANSYAIIILAIFVLHFLGWHLGTLYRRHHEEFPWLYQRHDHLHGANPAKGFEVAPKRPTRRVRA
jgi:hypothetical protein